MVQLSCNTMKTMPSHTEIAEQVTEFVGLCMNTDFSHNREGLDILIADLMQYRNTIASVEEYMDKNLL